MKSLELEMRLRNNRLKRRREQLGLSGPKLCERVGISYSEYNAIESLRESPYCKDGSLRKISVRLCEFYFVLPEELFPEDVLAVKAPVQKMELDALDLSFLLPEPPGNPEELLMGAERQELVKNVLPRAMSRLTEKQRFIVRKRWGFDGEPETLRTVGDQLIEMGHGGSPERVRQLEGAALRRLRDHFRRASEDREELEK